MLAHYHGQLINFSELSRSFGISDMTVRKYIDILDGTFMVRVLQPWYANIGKRLVKRPKIYLRDPGIFHSLMNIDTMEQLLSHPKLGASWEGFALESISQCLGKMNQELYFWQIHTGSELDLFWSHGGKYWGIEFKFTDAPRKTRSMQIVIKDLNLAHLWVVYPGKDNYRLAKNISVLAFKNILEQWSYIV